jgi:UDP-N-acetylglucosamine:LPS N-acetylglucosamine transferase
MSLKVLLASMNVGGGHAALRDSLLASLRQADPSCRRFHPIAWDSADQSIHRFYRTVVYRMPPFQGVLFHLSEQDWAARVVAATNPVILSEVKRLLRDTSPDVVVSTHFLLSFILAKARHEMRLRVPLVTAIPDYGIPPRGYLPKDPTLRADAVIVMDPQARDHFLNRAELTRSQIHFSGFLTRAPFTDLADAMDEPGRLSDSRRAQLLDELRQEFPQMKAIRPERPTFLFLGGSAWARRTSRVIRRILSQPHLASSLNIIIASGKDRRFYKLLTWRFGRRANVNIFNFVAPKTIATLMAIADYPVLGSLAPATLHELLEVRCGPLFLFRFIPGTELPHVAFIEENRLGIYEPRVERMVAALAEVAGLAAPSQKILDLKQGFYRQALQIRTESKSRAMLFPQFVEAIRKAL